MPGRASRGRRHRTRRAVASLVEPAPRGRGDDSGARRRRRPEAARLAIIVTESCAPDLHGAVHPDVHLFVEALQALVGRALVFARLLFLLSDRTFSRPPETSLAERPGVVVYLHVPTASHLDQVHVRVVVDNVVPERQLVGNVHFAYEPHLGCEIVDGLPRPLLGILLVDGRFLIRRLVCDVRGVSLVSLAPLSSLPSDVRESLPNGWIRLPLLIQIFHAVRLASFLVHEVPSPRVVAPVALVPHALPVLNELTFPPPRGLGRFAS
eukprot:7566948-Pyramimonas_sp.AAC.1